MEYSVKVLIVVLGPSPKILSLEKSVLQFKDKFLPSKLCGKAYFCWWDRLQSWRANQTDNVSLVSGVLQRKGSLWGKTQLQYSPLSRGIQQGVRPRTINKKNSQDAEKKHTAPGVESATEAEVDKGISRGGGSSWKKRKKKSFLIFTLVSSEHTRQKD